MSERLASGVPGAGGGARFPAAAAGAELVEQLRSTLERAAELLRVLEGNLHQASAASGGAAGPERENELESRLATAETDVRELASRLVDSEHQVGRLMNLYVATYQLHATLEPPEVQATIAEIAINLLGAEQFVLLLRREADHDCEVALAEGMHLDPEGLFAGSSYHGGDPMVDATLEDGVLRLGPTAESRALAAVPLRVQGEVVGAIVLLKLLDHKPILRAEDRDLLDLLSAHAASALFAARLFATKDRKLRTLESLVKLARGE
ncbi:MAG TPA: GAF domain-containing protein [Thermoanaerobaculia bacterium]|nr:GAF domain-containing protein [Thermoanaerobaculia bacterium]